MLNQSETKNMKTNPFIIPVDCNDRGEEYDIAFDFCGLRGIIDEMEKDEDNAYGECSSTKTCSPVDNLKKLINGEDETEHRLSIFRQMQNFNFNKHSKQKTLKITQMLKKSWKSKITPFRETQKSKIISKLNFISNDKINHFNLNPSRKDSFYKNRPVSNRKMSANLIDYNIRKLIRVESVNNNQCKYDFQYYNSPLIMSRIDSNTSPFNLFQI